MPSCAPAIVENMTAWVALGGGNSGCVANLDTHFSGFHLTVNQIRSQGRQRVDYSCTRDPNGFDGPFADADWACAGDFRHGGKVALRERHRVLLARLMAGDPALSMICEMITQPWADRPVYYWARWNGVATLQRYTGSGHDMWSHVSWYRSRADQRVNLWEDPMTPEENWNHDLAGTASTARLFNEDPKAPKPHDAETYLKLAAVHAFDAATRAAQALAAVGQMAGRDVTDEPAIIAGVLAGLGTKPVEAIEEVLRAGLPPERIAELVERLQA